MPATRRKGPVWVKERDRGVTLWGRARPMMEGERAPLRDHAKRVGNRRKPASVCRDGHLTRKSKSKSKSKPSTVTDTSRSMRIYREELPKKSKTTHMADSI